MEGDDNVITYDWMQEGFTQALVRLGDASRAKDPKLAYIALFEVLNWTVAIDERIGEHWAPDGELWGGAGVNVMAWRQVRAPRRST